MAKLKIAQNVIDELKIQGKRSQNDTKREYEDTMRDLNVKLQSEKVQNSVHRDVIQSMSPQIEKLKCDNEQLESQTQLLKDKLANAEAECNRRKAENDSLRSKLTALEKKADDSRELLQSTQSSQVSTAAELDRLKQDLESKTSESDNLAVDLIQMTDRCTGLEAELKELRLQSADVVELETRAEDLESQLKERNSAIDDLQAENQVLKESYDEARASRESAETSLESLRESHSSLQSRAQSLDDQIMRLNQEHRTAIEEKDGIIRVANEQAAQQDCKIAELVSANDSLKIQSESCGLQEKEIRELRESLQSSESALASAESRVCNLRDEKSRAIADLTEQLSKADAANQSKADKIAALEDQIHETIGELDGLRSTSQEQLSQLETLSRENELATESLERKDNSILKLEAHVAQLNDDNSTLAHGLSQRDVDLTAADRSTDDLKQQLLDLQAHVRKLEGDLETKDHQLEEEIVLHEKVASELRSLEEQLTSLNDLSSSRPGSQSDVELDNQSPSARQLQNSIESLKQQVLRLTQNNTSLHKKNDQLVLELDTVLSEKQVYIDEIDKLADNARRRKEELERKESELRKAVKEKEESMIKTKALEKQMDDSRELYIKSERQLQLQITDLNDLVRTSDTDNDKLNLLLVETTQERDELREKLDTGLAGQSQLKMQLKLMEGDKSAQQMKLEQNMLAAEEKLTESAALLVQAKAEVQQKTEQLSMTTSQLEIAHEKITEEQNRGIYLMNKQSEKTEGEMKALREQIDDLLAEREALKAKVTSVKRSVEEANVLTDLRQENQRLKSELNSLQDDHLEQITSSSAEVSILKARLENMEEHIKHLNDELRLSEGLKSLSTELQNRLREEKRAHTQTLTELDSIKRERMTFKEQLEDLREKHEHVQQKCDEMESDMKQVDDELSALRLQLSEKVQSESDAQDELTRVRDMMSEMRAERDSLLHSQISAADKTDAIVHKLEQELERKSHQMEALKANLGAAHEAEDSKPLALSLPDKDDQSVSSEADQLPDDNQPASAVETDSQEDDVSDDDDDSESEMSMGVSDEYIDALKGDNDMLSRQLVVMKNENEELTNQLKEAISSLNRTQLGLETAEVSTHQLAGEVKSLKEELSLSERQVGDLKNSLNHLETSKNSLIDELSTVREENLRLITQATHPSTNVTHELEIALEEKEKLTQQVRHMNDDIKNLQSVISAMKDTEPITAGEREDNSKLKQQLHECNEKIEELQDSLDVQSALHQTSMLASDDKLTNLKLMNNNLEERILEFESKVADLENKLQVGEDHKQELNQAEERLMALQSKCDEMSSRNKEEKEELTQEISRMKEEHSQLLKAVPTSSVPDRTIDEAAQHQIEDCRQQLRAQSQLIESLQSEKASLAAKLDGETRANQESEAEVQKLQMSIDLLMSTHQTEMSSLQKSLQTAKAQMLDLEEQITNYSKQSEAANTAVRAVNSELKDIRASKERVTEMVTSLVQQNSDMFADFQDQLISLVRQSRASDVTAEAPAGAPAEAPTGAPAEAPAVAPASNLSDSRSINVSTLADVGMDSGAANSEYQDMEKQELVLKLSEMTRQELVLRKALSDCYQSLNFYRSAVDNIIDCLGTAMPDVRKWAKDLLQV